MISTALPAYSYLLNVRKLDETTIRDFHLAYCDQNGEIYVDANFTGVFPNLPNVFKHSTLFPIFDSYSNIVGVSARPLSPLPNQPKYVNTVYEKKSHLYGLNVTWKECLTQQKVYVVEGNVDTLMMYQSEIKNVVGMLGSAFSSTQLCLLNRFVKSICFCPDGDKAGAGFIKKVKENIPAKFYDADIKFSYKTLPSGLDPDNFLKQFSKQDFLNLPEKEFRL